MARIRTLIGGIAAWIALTATASAAPVSWFDSQAALTAWYASQLNSAGSIYSPSTSAATLSNLPFNWYRPAPPAPVAVTTYAAPAAPYVPPAPAYTPAIPAQPIAAASVAPAPAGFSPAARFNATTIAAVAVAPVPANEADAFINLGSGPYAQADSITVGSPQPWYTSPAAAAVYGGAPSPDQQASFERDVLSKVQQTFSLSGVDVNLTTDPNVPADRMMSVVSGASYGPNPNAIGITQVGGDGFSFIDKLNYASNADQLSWAVAHNVAHELMHGFGVGSHPDTTGDHVDSAVADWKLLTDPNAKFSPAAVSLMNASGLNGADTGTLGAEILKSGLLSAQCYCKFCDGVKGVDGEQVLATPVPEPATVAVWMVGLVGGLALHRRRLRSS